MGAAKLGVLVKFLKFPRTVAMPNRSGVYPALGFFDACEFQTVENWPQFSPGSFRNPDIDSVASPYVLRLVYPSAKVEQDLNGCIDYAEWEKMQVIARQNPCMAVLLVNIAVPQVPGKNQNSETQEELLVRFSKGLKDLIQKENLSGVKFCTMHSMGYSDCAVFLAATDWNRITTVIQKLSSQADPLVSAVYSVPFYAGTLSKLSAQHFAGLTLSVRAKLSTKEGLGTGRNELETICHNATVQRVTGAADWLFTADGEYAASLLKWVVEQKLTKDALLIDSVSALQHTTNFFVNDCVSSSLKLSSATADELSTALGNFSTAVSKYEKWIKRHHRHKRIISVLQELNKEIETLCSQPHAESLRGILVPFLENVSYGLEQTVKQLNEVQKKNPKNLSEWMAYVQILGENIQQMAEWMGSYLVDLSRADPMFMELESYDHPTVGSVARLLVAYNRWLNYFITEVQQHTQPEDESDYKVLITSGGCDYTSTFDPFWPLDPTLKKDGKVFERVPLLIQMAEMSLVDFSGTILRATHECMHFVGDRLRDERVDFFVQSLSGRIAGLLVVESIEDSNYSIFPNETFQSELTEVSLALFPEVKKHLEEKLQTVLQEKLHKQKKDAAKKNKPNLSETMNSLQDTVKDILKDMMKEPVATLSPKKNGKSCKQPKFELFVYKALLESRKSYLEKCAEVCKNNDVSAIGNSLQSEKLAVYLEKYQEWKGSSGIYYPQEMEGHVRELAENIFHALCTELPDIVTSVASVYRETFSDVIACHLLNPTFTDYIFLHMYESWDAANSVFELTPEVQLRLCAVFSLFYRDCFTDEWVLTDDAKKEIDAAVDFWQHHSIPRGRFSADEICKAIESLTASVYQDVDDPIAQVKKKSLQEEIEPLVEYLESCKSKYDPKDFAEFRQAFEKIRFLSCTSTPSRDEKLENYHQLIQFGEKHRV